MDPKDIFELIIKADEKLKYSNAGNMEVRERQAKELLVQALAAAAPSPTADASCFVDPDRTSPAANTPGMLVMSPMFVEIAAA